MFSDVNVSQGSVATYARFGDISNNHFTANLPRDLLVKKFEDRLRFDRIIAMRLWSHFCSTLYSLHATAEQRQALTSVELNQGVDISFYCAAQTVYRHTHTHTHTLNGPLSRTTQVSRYQKDKTNLDFIEARDSEWQ